VDSDWYHVSRGKGTEVSFLRKQAVRHLVPPKSRSPGMAFGQTGLSTARGEAGYFIRLKWYSDLGVLFLFCLIVQAFCRIGLVADLSPGDGSGSRADGVLRTGFSSSVGEPGSPVRFGWGWIGAGKLAICPGDDRNQSAPK